MQTRWVGRESIDAIADVRLRCYGTSLMDRPMFLARTQGDRFADGDVLIAAHDGQDIGTATHLSLQMYVRGGRVPCQGVSWVGTVKSHRRRRVEGAGVASTIMKQLVARGRERGDVVSALMPFRASYYEHFGYGVVERQNIWTVPLSLLPAGDTDGFREATTADHEAMAACRTRQAQAGQCDVDTGTSGIKYWTTGDVPGFTYLDQSDGAVTSFATVATAIENDEAIAYVEEPAYDSPTALTRLLGLLGSLKDQYSAARIVLPSDLPLNWLLKERQVPHRRVDHPSATCNSITRMQLRVLDHRRLIEAMRLSPGPSGKVVVAVQESEGHESRFAIDFAAERASVSPSQATPDITMKDSTWAGVVTGALPARDAVAFGLAEFSRQNCTPLLDRFAVGPAAFSWEYF